MADSEESAEANKENKMQDVISWPGPRSVTVPRADNGFGFTLRHFIVYPPDSTAADCDDDDDRASLSSDVSKQTKSKTSVLDPMDTIFVKQVRDDGPAHHAGLQTGDRIVSVNGESVTGKTYSQVIGLIQGTDSALQLLVVPKDEDVLQMAYESSAYNRGREPHRGSAHDIPLPPTLSAVSSHGGPKDGEPAAQSSKPPLSSSRYRSELHVLADGNQRQRRTRRDASDEKLYADAIRVQQIDPRFMIPGHRISTSSIGSIASSGSLGSSKEQTLTTGDGKSSHASLPTNYSPNPLPPTRTSSKNITLSGVVKCAHPRSGSLESISRSSDSSGSRHIPHELKEVGKLVSKDGSNKSTRESANTSYFGSQERLLRTSYEKHQSAHRSDKSHHHRSSDDLIGPSSAYFSVSQSRAADDVASLNKLSTTGRLPASPHIPPPYTRAHTTSSLLTPNSGTFRTKGAQQAATSCSLSDANLIARHCSNVQSQPSLHFSAHEQGKPAAPPSRQPLFENEHNLGSNPHEKLHRLSGSPGDSYGLKISCKMSDIDEMDSTKAMYVPSARHSVPERPLINLVTERMRKFDSSDAVDNITSGGTWRHHSHISRLGYSKVPVPTQVGYDSVASRTAHFEQWIDELDRGSSEDICRSSGMTSVNSSARESPILQSRPPPDIRKVPATPPATINFYFRGDTPTDSVRLEPSPERSLPSPVSSIGMPEKERRSSRDSQSQGWSPQMSPRSPHPDDGTSSGSKTHTPALRQASYLSAINAPNNQSGRLAAHHQGHGSLVSSTAYVSYPKGKPKITKGLFPASDQNMKLKPPSGQTSMRSGLMSAFNTMAAPGWLKSDQEIDIEAMMSKYQVYDSQVMNAETSAPSAGGLTAMTTSSTAAANVKLRQQQTAEERDQKLKRRTSYLMATGKHHLTINTDRQGSPQPSPTSPSMGRNSETRPINDLTTGTTSIKAYSPDQGTPSPQTPTTPTQPSGDTTTPTKTSNIKKLKAFFGERTPRIVEATGGERKSVFELPSPLSEVNFEGALHCKMAVTDGKRANDRSWKLVWAVLRGHALYMYKDKSSVSPTSCDEQPVSVKSSIVDIAYDYTKKKNVFRLTTYNGSEYLFQADDRDVMLQWIQSIQTHNNPDEDKDGTLSSDLIIRKTAEQATGASPQMSTKEKDKEKDKDKKKTSTRSLRSKSPASHSPATKPKKYSEYMESPKTKDIKTWKGKMAKKFKRYGSSSSQSVDTPDPSEMMEGTFGIPLELCVPACCSEHVPQVVEVCTHIVETRGIENQGIYRVPGNTSAVNALQAELDRDPECIENVDLESDKWMDVNVVSSLLKLFFRKLPDPLITDELYENIINANKTENLEKRMLKIKKILHDLPDHNFETFKYLALHLNKVSLKDEFNKMDARNLAIVFGPTLVRPQEDSMVTMVRDMSDQCRIVESVISHAVWFFSSWDEDVHVPVDEYPEGSMQVSGMNRELLVKAENLRLGDRGKDTSAKDLVSSIIFAANKKVKIRKKEKSKVYDSIDMSIESEPSSYNERNIDAEIELHNLRQQMSQNISVKETASSSTTIATASSLQQMSTLTVQESAKTSSSSMTNLSEQRQKEGVYSAKMVFVTQTESESSPSSEPPPKENISTSKTSGTGKDVKRYPAYRSPLAGARNVSTDNAKSTFVRKVSEENVITKKGVNNQAEGSYQHSSALTVETKHHLRKMDIETKAVSQREQAMNVKQQDVLLSEHQVETERKKVQSYSEVNDAIRKPQDQSGKYGEYSSKFSKLMSASAIETTSITSDYSTNSSANATVDGKQSSGHIYQGTPTSVSAKSYLSDYSSTESPSSQKHDTSPVLTSGGAVQEARVRRLDTRGGNKYFTAGPATLPSFGKHAADDMALHAPHWGTPHFDTRKVAYKGTLQKKRQKHSPLLQFDETSGTMSHGYSDLDRLSRKGSLDSLLDFHNTSYLDSDSSEDLLQEIASADLRFKRLLSPQLGNSGGRMLPNERGDCNNRDVSAINRRCDQEFRDPSLHRLHQHRMEPKVGIASRFERSDMRHYNGEGAREVRSGQPPANRTYEEQLSKELTEQQKHEYAKAIRKSTEKLFLKDSQTSFIKPTNMPNISLLQQKSKSASPASYKRQNKRSNPRRHTVGGTADLEHFKALMALRQSQEDGSKQSAWERLRPNVVDSDTNSPTLQTWLLQQRIKHAGSSPALYEAALSVASSESSSAYPGSHTPATATAQTGAGTPSREFRGMFRPNSPGSFSTSSSTTSQSGSTKGKLTFESAI